MHKQSQYKKYFVISNLNLSTQIALGFCLIVLFFIAVNVSNIWVNQDLVFSLRQIDAEVSPIVKTSKKIDAELNDAEILTLKLLASVNKTQFDARLAELESNLAGFEAHLDALQKVSLSGEIANKFASNIELLEANHKPSLLLYQEIIDMQLNIVESAISANEVSDKLAIQEQALRPLIDDIYFMIDDDFLITSLYEVTASLNFGLFKIEKINNVTNQAELDVLTAEFNMWLGDYGGILSSIGFASNDEVFTAFLTKLAQPYRSIITLVTSEDGLITLKEQKFKDMRMLEEQHSALGRILESSQVATKSILDLALDINGDLVSAVNEKANKQTRNAYIQGFLLILCVAMVSIYLTRRFRQSISQLMLDLGFLAEGRIRTKTRTNKNDEFSLLSNSLATVVGNLKKIISDINKSVSQVHDGVLQVNESTDKAAQNMNTQLQELVSFVAQLGELKNIADDVVTQTLNTNSKVTEASELSTDMRGAINSSKLSVEKVAAKTQEASSVISKLDEDVRNIEEVMETISKIADMTNLLALNAAIEAARAGDQGRGFAVVADEVRTLATRTQAATSGIKDKTESMITVSQRVVQAMLESETLVADSLAQSENVEHRMTQFDAIIQEVEASSIMIAQGSEKQAQTLSSLEKQVDTLTQLSHQSTTQITRTNELMSEQASISKELENNVKQFTVEA